MQSANSKKKKKFEKKVKILIRFSNCNSESSGQLCLKTSNKNSNKIMANKTQINQQKIAVATKLKT